MAHYARPQRRATTTPAKPVPPVKRSITRTMQAQIERIRELAQSSETQHEIGVAMGVSGAYVQRLISLMPDAQSVRAQLRGNRSRGTEDRRAVKKPPLPPHLVPAPQEIAEFKRMVALARRCRSGTRLGSEAWNARDRRDEILVKWHENRVPLKDVARFGGVSVPAVAYWHRELITMGRITPRSTSGGRKAA